MSTQNTQVGPHARYVGRVGALAAALGIGVMIAASPGIANADSAGASASSSAGGSSESSGSEGSSPSVSSAGGSEAGTKPTSEAGASAHTRDAAESGSADDETSPKTDGDADAGPGATKDDEEGATDSEAPETTTPDSAGAESTESATPSTPSTPAATVEEPKADETTQPSAAPAAEPAVESAQSTTAAARSAAAAEPTSAAEPTPKVVTVAATEDADTDKAASVSSVAPPSDDAATSVATVPAIVVTALVAPVSAAATDPVVGVIGFLNHVVASLLDPFLAPAPASPDLLTPVIWAVLGWVRRNVFNEAPTISYNSAATVQTGQTITGNIGATDPEGDALTYTVTQGPQHGSLTIDQATGAFTYMPDDINYTAAQADSFTVSVTDGKGNLMSLFGVQHGDAATVDVTVLNPTVERVIVSLPAGFTDAQIPRFAADGQSLLFSATPPDAAAGARREIYNVNVDGTGLTCLTCGLADPTPPAAGSTTPRSLFKPVPFEDGSGRILMQSVAANGSYTNVVYENDADGARLVRILTPAGKAGVIATDAQREMRISPDGTHVLFSQIQLVPNSGDSPGFLTAVPIVGALTAGVDANGNKVYNITDARVVYAVGEGKQWTHDGKGVIVQGGLYDSGNVDDVVVDLATGQATRLTGNLDYDEDVDLSPNNQWLAIDSARGLDALTPVSRIVRPAFVALLIQGSVYTTYAGTGNYTNVSNQPWLVAVEDDLKGEDGIPLFVSDNPSTPEDEGDNWTARSMPSWNADGTEVAFWEANATGQSRLVVAKLKYTTSVGEAIDQTTPDLSSSLPTLASNIPQQVELLPTGTYSGAGGGSAVVTQTTLANGHIVRSVTYTDYVNVDGMILNGTESTDQSAAQNTIHYIADITVTGTHTGSLTGDATINKLTRTITATTPGSMIQSTLDGDTLVLLDPARVAAAQAST